MPLPMPFLSRFITAAFVVLAPALLCADTGNQGLWTGQRFAEQLRQPISASWNHVSVREIFSRVTQNYRIAILLDRRIDPTQELAVEVNGDSLWHSVRAIAERAGAQTTVVGNVVYVGPADSVRLLRTLVELVDRAALQAGTQLQNRRYFDLARFRAVRWQDLARPVEILKSTAAKYALDIENDEQIPHDLWAECELPGVNAFQALSLVLIQFNSTFAWNKDMSGFRIVPIPSEVYIERAYPVESVPSSTVLQTWRARIPHLRAEAVDSGIIVRGTIEEHELVDLMRGTRTLPPADRRTAKPPVPLSRREFTFRFQNAPISSLMDKLRATGIVFQYDPAELSMAGISFEHRIDMNAEKVSAEEFFSQVFGPLGLDVKIDGITVQLRPR